LFEAILAEDIRNQPERMNFQGSLDLDMLSKIMLSGVAGRG
jgi:hypothetical protein